MLETDLVNAAQEEGLGLLTLLDEIVTSSGSLNGTNIGGVGTHMSTSKVCLPEETLPWTLALRWVSSWLPSLNKFFFSRNLATSQVCVLCGQSPKTGSRFSESVHRSVTSVIKAILVFP